VTQILVAVCEKGTFRPVKPVEPPLADGQHLRLVVETDTPEDILRWAAAVYEDLSEQDIVEIECISSDRSSFFSKPTV
jgi:predicted DNA-binding antitoxin AbrB/MazE fold protein